MRPCARLPSASTAKRWPSRAGASAPKNRSPTSPSSWSKPRSSFAGAARCSSRRAARSWVSGRRASATPRSASTLQQLEVPLAKATAITQAVAIKETRRRRAAALPRSRPKLSELFGVSGEDRVHLIPVCCATRCWRSVCRQGRDRTKCSSGSGSADHHHRSVARSRRDAQETARSRFGALTAAPLSSDLPAHASVCHCFARRTLFSRGATTTTTRALPATRFLLAAFANSRYGNSQEATIGMRPRRSVKMDSLRGHPPSVRWAGSDFRPFRPITQAGGQSLALRAKSHHLALFLLCCCALPGRFRRASFPKNCSS